MFAEPSRGQDRADKRQKTIMNILVLEKHQHAMALFHIYIRHKCDAPLAIELRSHPRTKGTFSQRSLRICWYFCRGCVDVARVLANQDASTYARLCSDGERCKYAAQALLPLILSGRPATTRLLAQLKSNIYRAAWQPPAPESQVQSCVSLVLGTSFIILSIGISLTVLFKEL